MDHPFKSPTILSLCTGMRGLERGIERAIGTTHTLAHVEIEAFIIENLVQQMEKGVLAPAPIWSNVKTFPAEPFHGKVHGITGGYPCQPFSVAGNQKGTEDPRHLWPHILRIITAVRPVWCFFENVPGHIKLGFREVRSQLQGLGYKVEAGIYSAAEVGAPHQRKRLFILAVENSAGERWRRRSDVSENGGRTFQTERSRSLDDTDSIRYKSEHEIPTRRNSTEHASEERLADSDNNRERSGSGETKSQGKEIEGTQQRKERNKKKRERMRSKSGNEGPGAKLADTKHDGSTSSEIRESIEVRSGSGETRKDSSSELEGRGSLSDTVSEGLQSSARPGLGEVSQPEEESKGSESRGVPAERWPARPGEDQYDWEPPRVESRVGYVLNGHDYREDLLRMAGNAVVPQCSAKAFITLLKKHGIELNP